MATCFTAPLASLPRPSLCAAAAAPPVCPGGRPFSAHVFVERKVGEKASCSVVPKELQSQSNYPVPVIPQSSHPSLSLALERPAHANQNPFIIIYTIRSVIRKRGLCSAIRKETSCSFLPRARSLRPHFASASIDQANICTARRRGEEKPLLPVGELGPNLPEATHNKE